MGNPQRNKFSPFGMGGGFTLLFFRCGLLLWGVSACRTTEAPSDRTRPSVTTDTSQTTLPTTPAAPRAVILMIGDGMGYGAVEAASYYTHGAPTGFAMQTLPVHGAIRTANLDGIGDSASCGTAMAAGQHTRNGAIGMDRNFATIENLVETAAALDWGTGVVTTSEISHATPAVFTAHHQDRNNQIAIAELQLESPVDVLLGGGWAFVVGEANLDSVRTDDGLLDEMATAGITWVESATALDAATSLPLFGAFAPGHLPFYVLRDGTEDIPSLAEMTTAALTRLEDNPQGLFLMVEGARIDHAGHGNNLVQQVGEVQTFDEAVQAVLDWSATQPHEVTLIITADHETGGLTVINASAAGELPTVDWQWGFHVNDDVPVFAEGPGTDVFDQALLDQTWVHAVLHSRITDTPVVAPVPGLVPDGRFDDLAHRVVTQVNPSSMGDNFGRLDALYVDADENGLSIGIEGLFPQLTHTVSLVLDVDFGDSTGPAQLAGYANDVNNPVDATVSALPLLDPNIAGFGVDFVVVSLGGVETPYLGPFRGLRGLHDDWGSPTDLMSFTTGLNYGVTVRSTSDLPLTLVPGEGYEAYIPWTAIWPDLQGAVPPQTVIAVAAVATNLQGDTLTNQVLPPFPQGTGPPGTTAVALPGLVIFPVDEDGDGIASGAVSPYVLP